MTLKQLIEERAKSVQESTRELSLEEAKKVSGGHDTHFGKGCVGDWEDTSCGFEQACTP